MATEKDAATCKKAAEVYAGVDWHRLSPKERELVTMLEEGGYLTVNNPPNGFVGGLAFCPSPILLELCQYFRDTGATMIHLQPADITRGYVIKKSAEVGSGVINVIEFLVSGFHRHFASREELCRVLSRVYSQFDLVEFENCVAEFLRIERGLADGSVQTKPPPPDLF